MPLHTYSFRHLMCLDSTHPKLRFIHGASRIWRQLLPASHSACSTSHDHRTHSFGDINSQVEVNWRRSPITKKNDATVKLSNTISGNEIPSTVKNQFEVKQRSSISHQYTCSEGRYLVSQLCLQRTRRTHLLCPSSMET